MYQNKYSKMNISIGLYSINKPEAGYGWGGVAYTYIYLGAGRTKARDKE